MATKKSKKATAAEVASMKKSSKRVVKASRLPRATMTKLAAQREVKVLAFIAAKAGTEGVSRATVMKRYPMTNAQWNFTMTKLYNEGLARMTGNKRSALWFPTPKGKRQAGG